jgi:hypothetical protein
MPLISGSLEDIKYSIHQHFIKDCYKALGIPCVDYIFIHGIVDTHSDKCPISTGILLKDYKDNRTHLYKYNINNFLIDSIFMFNSIKHDNKKLNLLEKEEDGKIYADKIEGFRDAGAYLNGSLNPLFKKGCLVGEHIQYMRDWKHMFIKYKEATREKLRKHFKWCHNRITKLMKIISYVSENYLIFIRETLKTRDQQGIESVLLEGSKEYTELFNLITNLKETLLERASFYQRCTQDDVEDIDRFIDSIKNLLSDNIGIGIQENTLNSELYKDAIHEELNFYDPYLGGKMKMTKPETDRILGTKSGIDRILGIHQISFKETTKVRTKSKYDTYIPKQIDHKELYERFKNVPISESKDMRYFNDMPLDMKEYYGGMNGNYINIMNNCHFRLVVNEDVNME